MQAHCWRVRAGATNAGEHHLNNVNLIRLKEQGFELKYITYNPAEISDSWNLDNPVKFFRWIDSEQTQHKKEAITEKQFEKDIASLYKNAIAYSSDIIENKSRQLKPFGNLPEQIFLEVLVKPESEKLLRQSEFMAENEKRNLLYLSIQDVVFKARCTIY